MIPNTNPERIHDAIDGRVFFFPETEVADGWDTPVGDGSEVWYQVGLGAETEIGRAEIAFFADEEQGFDVPERDRFQVEKGGWGDVKVRCMGGWLGMVVR